MDDTPQFGKLIEDGERRRDAVHVAAAPVTAAESLSPGQHIGLVQDDSFEWAGVCDTPIGIVDPFLTKPVERGERFWMWLYPHSVTGLRHAWTHPAFTAVAGKRRPTVQGAQGVVNDE